MGKIGQLEIRNVRPGLKVVKLPGHEYDIEHFLPQNHESVSRLARAMIIRSKLAPGYMFVRKPRGEADSPKLDELSEARLAAYINGLDIPGIKAEQPLAVIMHTSGAHNGGGVTLYDLELFRVSEELRKRLGLKYVKD